MPSETTPLLSGGLPFNLPAPITDPRSLLPGKPPRTHFLDNLRATLVLLLVFHHASANILQRTAFDDVENRTKYARAVLSAFTQTNTQILWPTLFLVSGWAAHLALVAKPDKYAFVKKRVVWTLFPALAYLVLGRWLIVKWVDAAVFASASSKSSWTPYAQLTGPVPYILALVIMDIGHAAVRLCASKMPAISRRDVDVVLKVVVIMAAVSLVVHASAVHQFHAKLIPAAYDVFFPGDSPGYGAPTTFVIAYTAGVNGPSLEKHVLATRRTIAVPAALASLGFAYFHSLIFGAIQNAGYSAIYYPIVFFATPWSLLSLFTTVDTLKCKWATSWVSWTWLVAYVHVVPTIFAIYALQTPQYFGNVLLLCAFCAGAAGAIVTWAIVAVIAKVWWSTRWIRRGGRLSMILITRRL